MLAEGRERATCSAASVHFQTSAGRECGETTYCVRCVCSSAAKRLLDHTGIQVRFDDHHEYRNARTLSPPSNIITVCVCVFSLPLLQHCLPPHDYVPSVWHKCSPLITLFDCVTRSLARSLNFRLFQSRELPRRKYQQ